MLIITIFVQFINPSVNVVNYQNMKMFNNILNYLQLIINVLLNVIIIKYGTYLHINKSLVQINVKINNYMVQKYQNKDA